MIESLMLIGIGICAGCLLVLVFIPLVHRRSARLTMRYLVETAPPVVNALQADKDRLRAEFATAVRRLEVSVEEMRPRPPASSGKSAGKKWKSSGCASSDKKVALVFALRYRDKVRKNIVRRMAKLMFYAFVRAERRHKRELFGAFLGRSLAHPGHAHMASTQT
jgi:hypothetical protein